MAFEWRLWVKVMGEDFGLKMKKVENGHHFFFLEKCQNFYIQILIFIAYVTNSDLRSTYAYQISGH